jgi:hypothetical protein
MKAWLYAKDRAQSIMGEYQIVFDRNAAVEFTENNAHELMRAAENQFKEYRWEMVQLPQSGRFIVEGTKRIG